MWRVWILAGLAVVLLTGCGGASGDLTVGSDAGKPTVVVYKPPT